MFPINDDNPTELTPWVTFALIGACVAVWLQVQGAGAMTADGAFVHSLCSLGTIPAEVARGVTEGQVDLGDGVSCALGGYTWQTLFTSMFLHGSWMHLLGNLWFLWIFGNNIEDSMGHTRFLAFYLLTGVLASAAHILSAPGSVIPTVGASGAISGVLGAYFVLYPRAKVRTFAFIFFFKVPAALFLGLWFMFQLTSSFADSELAGGVAFWAHIGGFLAGVALVKLFENRTLVEAKRAGVRLEPRQIQYRGWL